MALVFVPGTVQAAERIDLGIAEIHYKASKTPHCVADVDRDACPLGWDDSGSPTPGDDSIYTQKAIDRVSIIIHVPEAEEQRIVVDPSSARLNHPVFTTANATWKYANGSLPSIAKRFVSLDSQPSWGNVWALTVTLKPPVSLGPYDGLLTVPVLCWDLYCHTSSNGSMPQSDEYGIQFFPYDVWTLDFDSDGLVKDNVDGPTTHWNPKYMPGPVLSLLFGLREAVEPFLSTYRQTTPNVYMGVQINKTALHVNDGKPLGTKQLYEDQQATGNRLPSPVEWKDRPRTIAVTAQKSPATEKRTEGGPGLVFSNLFSAANPVHPTIERGNDPLPAFVAILAGILGVLAGVLYSRINRSNALAQATRTRIFEEIKSNPGIRAGTLAAKLDLNYRTVQRHVLVLQRVGLVNGVGRGQTGYFAKGANPAQDCEVWRVLRNPSARLLYGEVQRVGEGDLRSLSERLELSHATVSQWAIRLERAGLVKRTRIGRRIVLTLARGDA